MAQFPCAAIFAQWEAQFNRPDLEPGYVTFRKLALEQLARLRAVVGA